MQKIDIANDYPIEIAPPDISDYAAGNTGIPYTWTFESDLHGPHAMISAIVHGNEPAGAIALDWLLKNNVKPTRGKLSLIFMNVAAYEAFTPDNPNASRWVEEDMNRVWAPDVLDGPRDSIELRRAREVRPLLDTVDVLFDIHTMQHLAPPLMMSGRHPRAMDLAAQIGLPERVVADFGHKSGRRMRDYGAFDQTDGEKTALLIECGQHWQISAGHLARKAALRFLEALDMVEISVSEQRMTKTPQQTFYQVRDAVTITSSAFRFVENYSGGETIAKKGTIIGYDGNEPVRTPEDNVMLVMPSKRLWKGQTAVRLAERIDR